MIISVWWYDHMNVMIWSYRYVNIIILIWPSEKILGSWYESGMDIKFKFYIKPKLSIIWYDIHVEIRLNNSPRAEVEMTKHPSVLLLISTLIWSYRYDNLVILPCHTKKILGSWHKREMDNEFMCDMIHWYDVTTLSYQYDHFDMINELNMKAILQIVWYDIHFEIRVLISLIAEMEMTQR